MSKEKQPEPGGQNGGGGKKKKRSENPPTQSVSAAHTQLFGINPNAGGVAPAKEPTVSRDAVEQQPADNMEICPGDRQDNLSNQLPDSDDNNNNSKNNASAPANANANLVEAAQFQLNVESAVVPTNCFTVAQAANASAALIGLSMQELPPPSVSGNFSFGAGNSQTNSAIHNNSNSLFVYNAANAHNGRGTDAAIPQRVAATGAADKLCHRFNEFFLIIRQTGSTDSQVQEQLTKAATSGCYLIKKAIGSLLGNIDLVDHIEKIRTVSFKVRIVPSAVNAFQALAGKKILDDALSLQISDLWADKNGKLPIKFRLHVSAIPIGISVEAVCSALEQQHNIPAVSGRSYMLSSANNQWASGSTANRSACIVLQSPLDVINCVSAGSFFLSVGAWTGSLHCSFWQSPVQLRKEAELVEAHSVARQQRVPFNTIQRGRSYASNFQSTTPSSGAPSLSQTSSPAQTKQPARQRSPRLLQRGKDSATENLYTRPLESLAHSLSRASNANLDDFYSKGGEEEEMMLSALFSMAETLSHTRLRPTVRLVALAKMLQRVVGDEPVENSSDAAHSASVSPPKSRPAGAAQHTVTFNPHLVSSDNDTSVPVTAGTPAPASADDSAPASATPRTGTCPALDKRARASVADKKSKSSTATPSKSTLPTIPKGWIEVRARVPFAAGTGSKTWEESWKHLVCCSASWYDKDEALVSNYQFSSKFKHLPKVTLKAQLTTVAKGRLNDLMLNAEVSFVKTEEGPAIEITGAKNGMQVSIGPYPFSQVQRILYVPQGENNITLNYNKEKDYICIDLVAGVTFCDLQPGSSLSTHIYISTDKLLREQWEAIINIYWSTAKANRTKRRTPPQVSDDKDSHKNKRARVNDNDMVDDGNDLEETVAQ